MAIKKFNLNKLQGKDLSYNNYNDIFASLYLLNTLPTNKGVVIVKHANPSGVSIEKNKLKSYVSAMKCVQSVHTGVLFHVISK